MLDCPVCDTSAEPAARVDPLAVCGHCGATLYVDAGGVRRATGAETAALSDVDLQTLRRAHGSLARPDRRPR